MIHVTAARIGYRDIASSTIPLSIECEKSQLPQVRELIAAEYRCDMVCLVYTEKL